MREGELDILSNEPVEGPRLSDRLAIGPLPAEEALQIALELGAALSRLHADGKVHGSLSPEAIVLASTGVRVLQPRPRLSVLDLPYRAPEQVRGDTGDWRSDIFAFGSILYELAAGNRAFPGIGAELDQAILQRSPAQLMAKSPIHAAMEGVIASCLQKDPVQRRQRVQNAVIELKLAGRSRPRVAAALASAARPAHPSQTLQPPAPQLPPGSPTPFSAAAGRSGYWEPSDAAGRLARLRRRFLVIGLAVLALAASVIAAALYLRKQAVPVLKFSVAAPEHTSYPGTPAVSPDGLYLTFSAVGPEGQRMLWLRSFDEMHARVLPGTEGGFAPFWSPDSQYIGFFAHQSLMKIRVNGSDADLKPLLLCEAGVEPGGGTWNRDGVILFTPSLSSGLFRVSGSGGNPVPVLKLNESKGERGDLWPQFLPDDKHFIYFGLTGMAEATTGVYAASLDQSEKPQFLFLSATNAVYSTIAGESSSTGYLLYVKDRDLMGQGFNTSRPELVGDPVLLANDIGAIQTLSLAPISVSRNAVLVYQSVGKPTRQLVWMDRSGRTIGHVGDPGEWGPPRIAPDGVHVAAGKMSEDGRNADIWIFGNEGPPVPFEVGTGYSAASPVWSPDGSRIAFAETRNAGIRDIFVKPAGGNRPGELLYKSGNIKYPTDWSRDGKSLLFGEYTPDTRSDLWTLNLSDKRANAVVDTVHSEAYPALSPDGRWLAYESDESGRYEIFVQPWDGGSPGTKRRWQVSSAGGGLPRWSGNQQELFYLSSSGGMMSVPVHPSPDEFRFDPPRQLFQTRPIQKAWNLFDVTSDGQRFLINLPLEWSNSALITVITNWTEKLKKLTR